MNNNDELILHHYEGSPFSEKLRLILGFKGLAWRSVRVPVILPKPDVVALTGGYRKTPFLQIGADIYCDTALMARVLEARQPAPTLFPATAALAPLLAQWADSSLFWTIIPYTMQPAGMASVFAGVPPEVIKAFAADRAPFTAGMKRQTVADATAKLVADSAALDAQLADGRSFLFGDAPSIADFSVAHCVWYVHRGGSVAALFERTPRLLAWYGRMQAFGHGRPTPLSSADALAIAANAGGHAPTEVLPGLGFAAGQAVTVTPTDYGCDPVAGTLVGLSGDTVVLRRDDERAGVLHVHFPRTGFQIKPQETPA
ncbi:MAG: glutathione S-transferase family protein [Rubrivivax sp.]